MARRRLEAALLAGKDIASLDGFKTCEEIRKVPFDKSRDGIFCLQFSMDGETLAVGHGNGGVVVMNPKTGDIIGEPKKSRYGAYPTLCMKWHPQHRNIFFTGDAEGNLFSCNIEDMTSTKIGNEQKSVKEEPDMTERNNHITCMDFSADGYYFATAGKDLTVRIYDTKTQELVKEYEGYHSNAASNGDDDSYDSGTSKVKRNPAVLDDNMDCGPHGARVFALKWHPELDNIFITAGWDNHLKIWDVRSNVGVRRTIHGPHICGDALDVRDYTILTGSWNGLHSLQMWDYTEGTLIKEVPFPAGANGPFLYCAQFADNNCVLAGGSGTNSVAAINTETDECLGEVKMEKVVQAMDSTAGGRLFAVGGTDNYLKIGRLI